MVDNQHTPETINVSGTKTWVDDDDHDGQRPDSITVKLLADGIGIKSLVTYMSPTQSDSNADLLIADKIGDVLGSL